MEMEDANARTAHKGRWQKNEGGGGGGRKKMAVMATKINSTGETSQNRQRDRGAEQRQMQTKKHQEDLLESSPVLPSSWSVQSGPAACEPDNQYSWNTIPVP